MSSASTSATSTSSGHTELSSSDHQIAAAQSILHPRPQLARLKSGGATFSAGYSMNTNSQRDRVCAPHARGDSFRKIAEDLNEASVPTAQGGAQWYAATVRHVLLRTS